MILLNIVNQPLTKQQERSKIMKTYYAILQPATDSTIFTHERNIYNAMGKHIVPQWFNKKRDTVILFEVTVNEDGTEYYSNAWGHSDVDNYIIEKMKRFDSWYNYIDKTARKFSGQIVKLS
jgi:hypothetical protein